jgi:hypothetical protein
MDKFANGMVPAIACDDSPNARTLVKFGVKCRRPVLEVAKNCPIVKSIATAICTEEIQHMSLRRF